MQYPFIFMSENLSLRSRALESFKPKVRKQESKNVRGKELELQYEGLKWRSRGMKGYQEVRGDEGQG